MANCRRRWRYARASFTRRAPLKLHPHSSAIIPLPALVLAVLCAMSGCAKEPEGSPAQGVVLITVDTLRADHLGSHGYPIATSPNIDALAKRGVLFRNASVQWPKTRASMASMLTGRYPKTTGLQLKPRVLPDSLLMLSPDRAKSLVNSGALPPSYLAGYSETLLLSPTRCLWEYGLSPFGGHLR